MFCQVVNITFISH